MQPRTYWFLSFASIFFTFLAISGGKLKTNREMEVVVVEVRLELDGGVLISFGVITTSSCEGIS